MAPMPVFTWKAPNIRPLPGAEWVASATPTPWTEDEITFATRVNGRGWPRGSYKAPANVGTAFYKTLRKLGYTLEGTLGDYR